MKKQKSLIAISNYPLSREYKKYLLKIKNKEIIFYSVSQLIYKKNISSISILFKLKPDELLIVTDNFEDNPLNIILQLIGCFTRSKKITFLNFQKEQKQLNRLRIIFSSINIFFGSLDCFFCFFKTYFDIFRLKLNKKNTIYKAENSTECLYLKSNLANGLKAGGSVGHITGVVNAMAKKFTNLIFISSESQTMLKAKNISEIIIPMNLKIGFPFRLNSYRFQYKMFNEINKNINLKNCKFIYQRLTLGNFLGVLISKKYNLPLIVEYNGSEVWANKNWGSGVSFENLLKNSEELMLSRADLVVTISDVLKNELIRKGIPKDRIAVYPNCIDPNIFNPNNFNIKQKNNLRKKLNIKNDKKVVTFIGTFGQWHGAEILAKAIYRIHNDEKYINERSCLEDMIFLFIGDGITLPKVKKMLNNSKSKNYCRFTGLINQEQAPKYLSISDCFISPHVPNLDGSRFFGSPTKLFEYMAMGKPIIASSLEQIGQILSNSLIVKNLPNNPPNINSSEISILVEPSNVSDIIKALVFLNNNPDWVKLLGINARREVLSKYTWDIHVEKILNKLK